MIDLIDLATAKLEPELSSVADARLQQLITVASLAIQNFLDYAWDSTDPVPEDLQFACARLIVSYNSMDQKGGAMQSESVPEYSYSKGAGQTGRNDRFPLDVSNLLVPYWQ